MPILVALLLGLVQGLCEFLPVSSSGHLVLLHTLFGLSGGTLFFTILLHLGTLLAVIAVYRKTLLDLLRHPFQKKMGMLLLALVPTVVMAALFRDFFEASYAGLSLGFEFLATACLLLLAQRAKSGGKTMQTMTPADALLVGLMQSVSILPAVSRSGATIAGGLFRGMEKKEAADFSFLLSVPAILGSVVFDLPALLRGGTGGVSAGAIFAGVAAAAVSGYFSIRVMLRAVTGRRLTPFAWYTGALGTLILADQFAFNRFFARPF